MAGEEMPHLRRYGGSTKMIETGWKRPKDRMNKLRQDMRGYKNSIQSEKNLCWMLPRPKPDHYKGGMPLYAEEWLLGLAKDILIDSNATILNVFCGMNKYGTRVDMNPEVKPDYIGDTHKLSSFLPQKKYDIIFADPPYSDEETDELYGKHLPRLHYKIWTAECDKYLKDGGLLIVYHKLVPANPNPEKYEVVKRVTIINRVWHLPRVAYYFQKKSGGLQGASAPLSSVQKKQKEV